MRLYVLAALILIALYSTGFVSAVVFYQFTGKQGISIERGPDNYSNANIPAEAFQLADQYESRVDIKEVLVEYENGVLKIRIETFGGVLTQDELLSLMNQGMYVAYGVLVYFIIGNKTYTLQFTVNGHPLDGKVTKSVVFQGSPPTREAGGYNISNVYYLENGGWVTEVPLGDMLGDLADDVHPLPDDYNNTILSAEAQMGYYDSQSIASYTIKDDILSVRGPLTPSEPEAPPTDDSDSEEGGEAPSPGGGVGEGGAGESPELPEVGEGGESGEGGGLPVLPIVIGVVAVVAAVAFIKFFKGRV